MPLLFVQAGVVADRLERLVLVAGSSEPSPSQLLSRVLKKRLPRGTVPFSPDAGACWLMSGQSRARLLSSGREQFWQPRQIAGRHCHRQTGAHPLDAAIQGLSLTCHWSFIQPRPEPVADLRLSAWDEQSPGARNPHRVQRVGRLRLSGAGRSLRGSGSRGPSGALRCCSR